MFFIFNKQAMNGISNLLSLLFRELSLGERKHKQLDELPPGAFAVNSKVTADVCRRYRC